MTTALHALAEYPGGLECHAAACGRACGTALTACVGSGTRQVGSRIKNGLLAGVPRFIWVESPNTAGSCEKPASYENLDQASC